MKTKFFFRSFAALFFCSALFSLFSFQNPTRIVAPNKIDSFSLSAGKIVFESKCSGCHGSKGEGSFGPNLCDNYWIHGNHYHSIVHVIKHGVKAKGMTAFSHKLTHAQVRDVAHYITITLKGTSPKNAKKPEGKKH